MEESEDIALFEKAEKHFGLFYYWLKNGEKTALDSEIVPNSFVPRPRYAMKVRQAIRDQLVTPLEIYHYVDEPEKHLKIVFADRRCLWYDARGAIDILPFILAHQCPPQWACMSEFLILEGESNFYFQRNLIISFENQLYILAGSEAWWRCRHRVCGEFIKRKRVKRDSIVFMPEARSMPFTKRELRKLEEIKKNAYKEAVERLRKFREELRFPRPGKQTAPVRDALTQLVAEGRISAATAVKTRKYEELFKKALEVKKFKLPQLTAATTSTKLDEFSQSNCDSELQIADYAKSVPPSSDSLFAAVFPVDYWIHTVERRKRPLRPSIDSVYVDCLFSNTDPLLSEGLPPPSPVKTLDVNWGNPPLIDPPVEAPPPPWCIGPCDYVRCPQEEARYDHLFAESSRSFGRSHIKFHNQATQT